MNPYAVQRAYGFVLYTNASSYKRLSSFAQAENMVLNIFRIRTFHLLSESINAVQFV